MVFIPEAADLPSLVRVQFPGPSVALLPDERRARCGSKALDALLESRQGVETAIAQRSGLGYGLLLVHSHRQRAAEFEQHARMISLIYRTQHPDPGLFHELSLLVVNNDASELLPHGLWHGHTDDPLNKWLVHYSVPMRIRMLLVTSLNLGYNCGELHALASSAPILQHFPWVLYCSGPDVLPTPEGMLRFGAEISRAWRAQATGAVSQATGLLYQHFPAPVGRQRIGLDLFLFWPARVGALFRTAAHECLRLASTASPEQLFADAAARENVTRIDSWMQGYFIWRLSKQLSTAPRPNAALWHSHNLTAVSAWLEQQERRANLTRERPLRLRPGHPLHC